MSKWYAPDIVGGIDFPTLSPVLVGKRELIGITTIPGFAYYGIPSQTTIFLVPRKAYADFEKLKMDVVYPKEVDDITKRLN